MRWQKRLRLAIAVFVVVFAAVVVVSVRRGRHRAPPPLPPKKIDDKAAVQTTGSGNFTRQTEGKTAFSIQFGTQATYEDGRSKFGGGVTVVLPDRNGRQVTIKAQDAEVTRHKAARIRGVTYLAAAAAEELRMLQVLGPDSIVGGELGGIRKLVVFPVRSGLAKTIEPVNVLFSIQRH